MARLPIIDPATATGKAKELLAAVQSKLSITPNMTKVMANSPAVLNAYIGFSGALGEGALDAKLREQLALVVAESNGCDYCLSAHSAIGKMVGLNDNETLSSRDGKGTTARATEALAFAQKIITNRGKAKTGDLKQLRAAGFNDGEIAEIIAHVALNIFTNYFNNITEVDIDFPKVTARLVA